MFESQGFCRCENSQVESGYDKIVIYADENDEFTHVAIQSRVGRWVSKLGDLEDVEHRTPEVLSGRAYGAPRVYMKRPIIGQTSLL